MEMVRRELLKSYNTEYILMTYADIEILNPIPIENVIRYLDIQCIAVPKDVVLGHVFKNYSIKIYQGSKINAGFIIIKNTDRAKQIFTNWIKASYDDCKKYSNIHPRNQNVFDNCIYPTLQKK